MVAAAIDTIKTRVLYQAIQDYVQAKAKLEGLGGKGINKYEDRGTYTRRLKDVTEFFNDPPFDYGDIDFNHVKRLCDDAARTGTRIQWTDTRQ